MAYATETRTGLSLGQRIAYIRATLADSVARNKVYRTTLNELSALTDRDLADLGISRSAIKSIALEAARSK